MAESTYAEWLAQGRSHQAEGRPVDALLCFRQAVRADPRAPDAPYHLGEVLWQLGRFADAIAAWRDALAIAPRFPAPAQALAEALLANADAAGAAQAAARVLTLVPGDVRAELIAGIAALTLAEGDADAAAGRVVATLARDPTLLTVATLAAPLAHAIERTAADVARARIADQVIRAAESPSDRRGDAGAVAGAGLRASDRRTGDRRKPARRFWNAQSRATMRRRTTMRCVASRSPRRARRPLKPLRWRNAMAIFARRRLLRLFRCFGRGAPRATGGGLSRWYPPSPRARHWKRPRPSLHCIATPGT